MNFERKQLDKKVFSSRTRKIVSTNEALKDITPFNFSRDTRLIVDKVDVSNVQSERHNNN